MTHPLADVRPPAPLGGALYAVRWVTSRGETASRLYRQRPAAERHAQRIRRRGGAAVVYVTRLQGWRTAP